MAREIDAHLRASRHCRTRSSRLAASPRSRARRWCLPIAPTAAAPRRLFFLVELYLTAGLFGETALRIVRQRAAFWGQCGNVFDAAVCVLSLVSFALPLLKLAREMEARCSRDEAEMWRARFGARERGCSGRGLAAAEGSQRQRARMESSGRGLAWRAAAEGSHGEAPRSEPLGAGAQVALLSLMAAARSTGSARLLSVGSTSPSTTASAGTRRARPRTGPRTRSRRLGGTPRRRALALHCADAVNRKLCSASLPRAPSSSSSSMPSSGHAPCPRAWAGCRADPRSLQNSALNARYVSGSGPFFFF